MEPINLTNHVRILLLGDQYVGKSSMLMRYGSDKFKEKPYATIGVDLFVKELNRENEKLEISIYDSSGQNRFREIISPFYRTCDAIILVYDITKRKSFENIKAWVELIQKFVEERNLSVTICGNKADLENLKDEKEQKEEKKIVFDNSEDSDGFVEIELNEENKNRKREVSKKEGKKFAKQYGFSFIECSAKTGENIQEAFSGLIDEVLKKEQKPMYYSKKGTNFSRIDNILHGRNPNEGWLRRYSRMLFCDCFLTTQYA